jgi:hypothetical protein
MENVPVPVLEKDIRDISARGQKNKLPVWTVLSLFENVADQVEILVFFMRGMLARSLVCGSFLRLELDIGTAGRAKFCCC